MKEYESEALASRVDNAKRYQGSIPLIQEYETILQRQIRNTFITAYRQGCKFFLFFSLLSRFKRKNESGIIYDVMNWIASISKCNFWNNKKLQTSSNMVR